ncbi:hypothetical protein GCK72_021751 [Caenorhabditis remanei]|uniref:Uncharacterized protein n=1 Tax=Caenorhabditis remanei TaxID=31234 RepID=A0A6A5GKZ2_CAERE|nr:hypothetical protein GCK72_021751 [Caenorhabditis remanei]KAF1755182.1 hypothetical protein GCK72_021751 [Caenorhabditis remanei]
MAAPKEPPTMVVLSSDLYTSGSAIGDGRVLIHETDKGKIARLKAFPEFRDIFVYEIEEKDKKNGGNMKKRPGKLNNMPVHEIILRAAMNKRGQLGQQRPARAPSAPQKQQSAPSVPQKQPTASSVAQEQQSAPSAPQHKPSAPLAHPKQTSAPPLVSTPQETSAAQKQPMAPLAPHKQPTAPSDVAPAPQETSALPAPPPASTPQKTSGTFWKKPNFYLIFLAPIYVPVISYFFSPVFDSIIFKFKEIVM